MKNSSKLSKRIVALLVAIVMVFQYGLGVSDVSAADHTMGDNAITAFSIEAYIDGQWKYIKDVSGSIERGARIRVSLAYDPGVVASKYEVNDRIIYTLPEGLKVTEAQSGTVYDGLEEVGEYEITTGGVIKIKITNGDYLAERNGRLKNGTVSFFGGFDGDYWEDGGTKEIKIGDFSFNIELKEKETATSGVLNVNKEALNGNEVQYDSNNNPYIDYKITVTAPAGNTQTMKDVTVEDVFTAGAQYISWVEVETPSKGSASVATGVWTIGNMAPGTTETLLIRAYLTASFFYVKELTNTSNRVVTNSVVVKSEGEECNRDEVTTQSNWGLNINKRNSGYIYDKDTGKGTVTYTVTVTAPNSNKETIKNVTVYDAFGGEDGVKDYVVAYTVNDYDGRSCQPNVSNKTLLWTIGDMASGEQKVLEYTVEIDNDIFNDGVDVDNDGVSDGVIERTLPNAAILKVEDKEIGRVWSVVEFKKVWIYKAGQIDYTDNRIKFVIQVNKSEEGTPELNGTLTVTDELSGEWAYDGQIKIKKYWVANDIIQEEISYFTPNTSTSWEIEVPGGYYYEFEYYAKQTGALIGESIINNKAGVGIGVGGTDYYHEATWQGFSRYYGGLSKEFVSANGNVATWTSFITADIPAGASYADYRNGEGEWYFTDEQIDNVVVKKGNRTFVKGVDYTIARVEGTVDRFEIIFEEPVTGVSLDSPIEITYDTTLNDSDLKDGESRLYENCARLKVGESRAYASADYIYYKDQKLTKSPGEYNAETGELTWTIRVNNTGSMAGNATLVDYIPEGLEYKDNSVRIIDRGEKASETGISSVSCEKIDNKDVVTIGLEKLKATHDTAAFIEIEITTIVVDEDFALSNTSKEYENTVELNYDGNIVSSTATKTITNTSLTKAGVYNESTAPFIVYTIQVNPEGHNMLKDGNLIKIVDEMSDKMMLKSDSIEIVTADGEKLDPIDLTVEGNVFTFFVPDDEALTITYKAFVQGEVGDEVVVSNKVSYFGNAAIPGDEIENKVNIARSMATIEGASGFYVVKKDKYNNSILLEGTEFTIYEIGTDAEKTEVADNKGTISFFEVVGTNPDTGEIETRDLSTDKVYAFKETKAKDGYLLDEESATPTYVAFKHSAVENAIRAGLLPEGIDADDVNIIQSGFAFERRNEKDSDANITFRGTKTLANANYDLTENEYEFTITGPNLKDASGNKVETLTVGHDADGTINFPVIRYDNKDLGSATSKNFEYTIQEKAGQKSGINYSDDVYTAKVTVTRNNDGTISTALTEVKKNGEAVDAITFDFVNTYDADDITTVVGGKKIVENLQLRANDYTFQIKETTENAENPYVATAKNDATGVFVLKLPTYTLADHGKTFTYEVSEVDDNKPGITYDGKIYTVTIKITDNMQGELKLEKSISLGEKKVEEISFTNRFDGSVELTKTNGKDGDAYRTLAGAEFALYKDGALYEEKLVTGENGKIKVENLPEGKYYFVETKAPAGHSIVKDEEGEAVKYEFEIGPNVGDVKVNAEITAANEQKLGSLSLIKKDAETAELIEGAVFDLYKDGTVFREGLVTDADGKIEVESLPWGEYYFVETSPAPGYVADATPTKTVVINADYVDGEAVTVEKTNKQSLGNLSLIKKDAATSDLIKGAKFDLYKDGEVYKKDLVTDANGKIEVKNLPWGEYYFVETAPAPGYEADAKATETVTINEEYIAGEPVTVEKTNEQKLGSLSLLKKDADSSALIEGAKFNLYNDGEVYKKDLVTDANGKIEVKELPWGEYYFVETSPAPGYALDATPTDKVVINADYVDGEAVTVEKINEKKLGSLSLVKKDEATSDLISGATFDLYKDGKVYKEGFVTDADGKIEVKELPWGEYYFVETSPAPGYVADATPTDKVVINADYVDGEAVTVEKTNKFEGSVMLTKTNGKDGEAYKTLAGAEFELYKAKADGVYEPIGKYTTGENGVLSVDKLAAGSYYFVETKAPAGYSISKEANGEAVKYEFEIGPNGGDVKVNAEITAVNEQKLGSLSLIKKDADTAEVIEGAKFDLYKDGEAYKKDLVTDENGKIAIENLPWGEYYFVETSPAPGYALDATPSEKIVINAEYVDGKAVTVDKTNEKKLGSLSLVKKDADTSSLIEGAIFDLYKDGELFEEGFVTDENGKIAIENLPWGEYYFVETAPAPGYVADATPTDKVVINAEYVDGEAVTVEKTNKFEGSVMLTKTNGKDGEAYKTLAGAEFELYKAKADGGYEPIGKYTTGENGVLSVDKLAEGSYYFVETKAPAGYRIVTDEVGEAVKYKFKIGPNGGDEAIDQNIVVANEQKLGIFILAKTDVDTKAPIKGVEFALYKDGELYQDKLFTDENGKIEVESLPWGEYYFVETSPAPGYVADETPTDKVVINAGYVDGDAVTVEKTNEMKLGSLSLVKKDADTAEVIEGATFDLYKDGEAYKKDLVTDAEGKIEVKELPWGEYYFVETSPAPGYVADATPTDKVVINAGYVDGDAVTVEKTNEMKLGSLSLIKKDADTAEVIEGATFDLYKDGEAYKKDLVTDAEGKIEVKELPWGEYYFVETAPAPGYVLDEKPTEKVVINADYVDGEAVTVEKTNKQTEFYITKTDINGENYLTGSTIEIFKVVKEEPQVLGENSSTGYDEEQLIPITSWTSDGSNHLIKGMLEVGETYIIKETAAPTGYGLLESYIEFTVNEDGSITSNANFTIDENGNRVLLVQDDIIDLKVTKTDYVTGKNLEGAVLAVFDKESGEEIVRWTSTKEGHYDFGAHLTANKTYILKELQAPEGYEKIDDVEFKVLNEGQVEVVTESEYVTYENGQMEIGNCPVPPEVPDTGDHTPLGMSMILMTLAMIGMVSAAMPRKRRSH